jgi:hypothetical protein
MTCPASKSALYRNHARGHSSSRPPTGGSATPNVYATFPDLVRTAGLEPRSERCHTRLPDFRHAWSC